MQVCEVACDSFFKKVVLFRDSKLEEAAQRCLEAFFGYGLRPPQIELRRRDHAFNYELTFSLFNGNGTFAVSAEKIHIHIKNATSSKDVEVISDCILKAYENIPLPEIATTSVAFSAHAKLKSDEDLEKYLGKTAKPEAHTRACGVIAYIQGPKWPQEIRFAIDRSLVYSPGLFLHWSTQVPAQKPTREMLSTLGEAIIESAKSFDLKWDVAEKS